MKRLFLWSLLVWFLGSLSAQSPDSLMGELDALIGQMSPEEQAAFNKQFEQFLTMTPDQIDAYVAQNFSTEEQQLYQELKTEFEKELPKYMEQPPAPAPLPEPIAPQIPEIKPSKEATKEPQLAPKQERDNLKKTLKELIDHVDDLFTKTSSAHRITSNGRLETLWNNFKVHLSDLKAYAAQVLASETVLSALFNETRTREQLAKVRTIIASHAPSITVPDAMGLEKAEKATERALETLMRSLGEPAVVEKLVWEVKALLRKHEPEGLRKGEQEAQAGRDRLSPTRSAAAPVPQAPGIPARPSVTPSSYQGAYQPVYEPGYKPATSVAPATPITAQKASTVSTPAHTTNKIYGTPVAPKASASESTLTSQLSDFAQALENNPDESHPLALRLANSLKGALPATDAQLKETAKRIVKQLTPDNIKNAGKTSPAVQRAMTEILEYAQAVLAPEKRA